MKILIMIFIFCFVFILLGCNKNDSTQDIKIKRNEVTGQKKSESDLKTDSIEKKSSGESTKLQIIISKEVKNHIGDSLIINGYIADVFLTDKVAYLNFENKFPKNVFACAIFSEKFNEFGDLSKYKNKNVEVTGKISTYKNKPQVILESKSQINIIQ